jgi:hypothetical protein
MIRHLGMIAGALVELKDTDGIVVGLWAEVEPISNLQSAI